MEYLSAEELRTRSLEEVVAYKSLLTHVSNLDGVSMGEININIARAEDAIVKNLQESMSNYEPGRGSKEMVNALVPQVENPSFLDGILEELRKAKEAQEQADKESDIATQKGANFKIFMPLYLEMTYPMPEVVRILGRDVLDIAGKDILAKLVLDKDMLNQTIASKENREGTKSRTRVTIAAMEH